MRCLFIAAIVTLITVGGAASAATTVPGTEYTVNTDEDYPRCCYIDFDQATTYRGFSIRGGGLVDFNISQLDFANQAKLSFRMSQLNFAAHPLDAQLPKDFITINYYQSNGVPEITDIQSPLEGVAASFTANVFSPGDTISIDITTVFNEAWARGWDVFGLRITLSGPDFDGRGAFAGAGFDNFVLSVHQVPEPETYLIMLFGIAGLAIARWRTSWREEPTVRQLLP